MQFIKFFIRFYDRDLHFWNFLSPAGKEFFLARPEPLFFSWPGPNLYYFFGPARVFIFFHGLARPSPSLYIFSWLSPARPENFHFWPGPARVSFRLNTTFVTINNKNKIIVSMIIKWLFKNNWKKNKKKNTWKNCRPGSAPLPRYTWKNF